MKLEPITLIKRVVSGRDRLGQATYTVTTKDLVVEKIPVTRSEYFTAGQLGISADKAFKVSQFDYSGEMALKSDGLTYRIYRTYEPDDDWVELYCSLSIGQDEVNIDPDPPTPDPEPSENDEEGGDDE